YERDNEWISAARGLSDTGRGRSSAARPATLPPEGAAAVVRRPTHRVTGAVADTVRLGSGGRRGDPSRRWSARAAAALADAQLLAGLDQVGVVQSVQHQQRVRSDTELGGDPGQ